MHSIIIIIANILRRANFTNKESPLFRIDRPIENTTLNAPDSRDTLCGHLLHGLQSTLDQFEWTQHERRQDSGHRAGTRVVPRLQLLDALVPGDTGDRLLADPVRQKHDRGLARLADECGRRSEVQAFDAFVSDRVAQAERAAVVEVWVRLHLDLDRVEPVRRVGRRPTACE